jgi:hypothetical protein
MMMLDMTPNKLLFLFLLAMVCSAQQSKSPAKETPQPTKTYQITFPADPEVDTQAVVKETEQIDTRNHKMGVFWWIPADFWEAAVRKQGFSAEQANKVFGPFKGYNLFLVGVGDLGVGNYTWTKEDEIRKHVVMRDQNGNIYKPLEETPNEVGSLISGMKPMLKNMMGDLGEGMQFVLFTGKDSTGNSFADPHKSSEIFLDVSELMGPATSTYTWKLPLTSLVPPKFCPVGKEKVEANWKYCPWHGNKLDSETTPKAEALPKP